MGNNQSFWCHKNMKKSENLKTNFEPFPQQQKQQQDQQKEILNLKVRIILICKNFFENFY